MWWRGSCLFGRQVPGTVTAGISRNSYDLQTGGVVVSHGTNCGPLKYYWPWGLFGKLRVMVAGCKPLWCILYIHANLSLRQIISCCRGLRSLRRRMAAPRLPVRTNESLTRFTFPQRSGRLSRKTGNPACKFARSFHLLEIIILALSLCVKAPMLFTV